MITPGSELLLSWRFRFLDLIKSFLTNSSTWLSLVVGIWTALAIAGCGTDEGSGNKECLIFSSWTIVVEHCQSDDIGDVITVNQDRCFFTIVEWRANGTAIPPGNTPFISTHTAGSSACLPPTAAVCSSGYAPRVDPWLRHYRLGGTLRVKLHYALLVGLFIMSLVALRCNGDDGTGSTDATGDTAADTAGDTGTETTAEITEETTEDTGEETIEDTGEETTEDTGVETAEETTEDTGVETATTTAWDLPVSATSFRTRQI